MCFLEPPQQSCLSAGKQTYLHLLARLQTEAECLRAVYCCGDELPRNMFWLGTEELEMLIRARGCSQPPGEDKS